MKEIHIPALGESIVEATIAKWRKKQGQSVISDEVLLEIETEKVTMEVCAPCSGILSEILKSEGSIVNVGEVVGKVAEGKPASQTPSSSQATTASNPAAQTAEILSPAVRKIVAENHLNTDQIQGSGKDARITKGDALAAINSFYNQPINQALTQPIDSEKQTERVKMSRLRKTIAARLKESQNTAAILTTFNEVDMSRVMSLRQQFKDEFEKQHQTKLGFMSFFIKAAVSALQQFPAVNAQIEGDDIIYKNYYDIGVAIGSDAGLVVPVIRNANELSFAEIEGKILEFSKRAKDGKLSMDDLSGATFSISNGGTYGSLLSTPIINPPQSGILGMHKIQNRPVVVNEQIVIRPMMYLALSYDHRLVDGKEAVSFLVHIKNIIENPERMLFSL